jgi:hypothetical protein
MTFQLHVNWSSSWTCTTGLWKQHWLNAEWQMLSHQFNVRFLFALESVSRIPHALLILRLSLSRSPLFLTWNSEPKNKLPWNRANVCAKSNGSAKWQTRCWDFFLAENVLVTAVKTFCRWSGEKRKLLSLWLTNSRRNMCDFSVQLCACVFCVCCTLWDYRVYFARGCDGLSSWRMQSRNWTGQFDSKHSDR